MAQSEIIVTTKFRKWVIIAINIITYTKQFWLTKYLDGVLMAKIYCNNVLKSEYRLSVEKNNVIKIKTIQGKIHINIDSPGGSI